MKNFKGIDNVKIEVEGGKSPGRFVTLVGLNEGGKTSIIEAIALSALQDPDTASLLEATSTNIDMADVVPKHHSAGFTGRAEITVDLDFSNEPQYQKLVEGILKADNFVTVGPLQSTIRITKWYSFEDSNYKTNGSTWTFMPDVKKLTGHKTYSLYKANRQCWNKCVAAVGKLLPRSVYFPTFLVDVPKRVYLEGDYGKVDSYYRAVFDDALNGLSTPLSLKKHIIDRVSKHRVPGQAFSSALRSSVEGRHIDATVQQLAAELNTVIFGAWSEIFKRPVKNRQIVIEWHLDEQMQNHVYLEFYIIAGDHRFYISERSLGFRWFFSFLLFTQFQGSRADKRKIIFLFDEPASHLHPKAQERLLASFSKIAEPNHVIIYSTHSHYLINPLWLEQAYIVSNLAIDADADATGIDHVGSRVKIKASKYKTFVSLNPAKTTYYQPILDVLDVGAGALDMTNPVVILEGKYDYYPFRYLTEKLGRANNFRIIPAVGAGSLSPLIGILRGWNLRFLIVLDDDDAGRKEKAKYRNQFLLDSNAVVTLDELMPALKDKAFEGVFQEDVKAACRKSGYATEKKVTKEQYYTYFQALQSKLVAEEPIQDTIKIFDLLLTEIETRLKA